MNPTPSYPVGRSSGTPMPVLHNQENKLNNTQVIFLQLLVKHPKGLTRDEINDETGIIPTPQLLGPTRKEDLPNWRGSLYQRGLVIPHLFEQDDGENVVIWKVTPLGYKLAGKYKARTKLTPDGAIPADVLDPIVREFKKSRTYGFEHYTDEDMQDIRDKLGEEYADQDLHELRLRIINRRKQGAYSQNIVEYPEWYMRYRESKWWKELEEQALEFSNGACMVNSNHVDHWDSHRKEHVTIGVYHRHLRDASGHSLLDTETVQDVIVLCSRCYKRSVKFMCKIPERKLTDSD